MVDLVRDSITISTKYEQENLEKKKRLNLGAFSHVVKRETKFGRVQHPLHPRFGIKRNSRVPRVGSWFQKKSSYARGKGKFSKKRSQNQFQTRWFKCKKPFWRRKSYRKVKFLGYLFKNIYKVNYKDRLTKIPLLKKYQNKFKKQRYQKRLWNDYFKRSKIRYWFKNKILLRYFWMDRYRRWTHNKMRLSLLKYKGSKPSLMKFIQTEEMTLERFVIWWGIVRFVNEHQARVLILNGLIWVNFKPVFNRWYQVRKGDCVFFFSKFAQRLTKSKQKLVLRRLLVTRLYQFGKTKFLRGYPEMGGVKLIKFDKYGKPWRYRKNFLPYYVRRSSKKLKAYTKLKRFSYFLKKYLLTKMEKMRKGDAYFLHFFYFFEKSRLYRIFISLYNYTWFVFLFSDFANTLRINRKILNWVVNFRYF